MVVGGWWVGGLVVWWFGGWWVVVVTSSFLYSASISFNSSSRPPLPPPPPPPSLAALPCPFGRLAPAFDPPFDPPFDAPLNPACGPPTPPVPPVPPVPPIPAKSRCDTWLAACRADRGTREGGLSAKLRSVGSWRADRPGNASSKGVAVGMSSCWWAVGGRCVDGGRWAVCGWWMVGG